MSEQFYNKLWSISSALSDALRQRRYFDVLSHDPNNSEKSRIKFINEYNRQVKKIEQLGRRMSKHLEKELSTARITKIL